MRNSGGDAGVNAAIRELRFFFHRVWVIGCEGREREGGSCWGGLRFWDDCSFLFRWCITGWVAIQTHQSKPGGPLSTFGYL